MDFRKIYYQNCKEKEGVLIKGQTSGKRMKNIVLYDEEIFIIQKMTLCTTSVFTDFRYISEYKIKKSVQVIFSNLHTFIDKDSFYLKRITAYSFRSFQSFF